MRSNVISTLLNMEKFLPRVVLMQPVGLWKGSWEQTLAGLGLFVMHLSKSAFPCARVTAGSAVSSQ